MADKDRIPAEDLTAWERWELPVMNEQGEEVSASERVRPPTAAELEAIREAARQEGFQSGYEAGHKEGLAAGRKAGHQEGYAAGLEQGREEGRRQARVAHEAELTQQIQALQALLTALAKPLEQQHEALEQALVNLVLAICRAVIFREMQLAPEAIRDVVNQAVRALPVEDTWQVWLHPEDAAVLRTSGAVEPSLIHEDSGLTRGGCRVVSRESVVDYTLERRFQKTVQAMLAQVTAHAPAQEEPSPDYTQSLDDLSDLHTDVLEAPDEPESE
ncbi:MAG: flagellar assembly protein FliH [Gammaproteobacteria bacterium]|nr:MAG: flagellar assembly protein FliH [Gammaproteobacteria bacterium]